MRNIIIATCIFLSSFTVYAQPAVITMNDGTKKEAYIQATSTSQLYTRSGSFNFSNIQIVQFAETPTASMVETLQNYAIKLVIQPFESTPQQMLTAPQPTDVNLPDFEKFREARDLGKVLQFIGVLAIGTASYLSITYAEDNADNATKPGYEPKSVSPYIPLAGVGVMAIGIAIDIGAGKHLKVKGKVGN